MTKEEWQEKIKAALDEAQYWASQRGDHIQSKGSKYQIITPKGEAVFTSGNAWQIRDVAYARAPFEHGSRYGATPDRGNRAKLVIEEKDQAIAIVEKLYAEFKPESVEVFFELVMAVSPGHADFGVIRSFWKSVVPTQEDSDTHPDFPGEQIAEFKDWAKRIGDRATELMETYGVA